MTLEEKIGYVHGNGTGPGYVGFIPGVERLGIPSLSMNDGPQGFRGPPGTSTAWPSCGSMAAGFNVSLMYAWAHAMAEEFRGKGAGVLFGPGVDLVRVPLGGRSMEYLTGEDPFLGSSLVVPVVRGIQDVGVIANVKHLALNNQENDRHDVLAVVDERTFAEIYLPVYASAVEAGTLSFMCSNNRAQIGDFLANYTCQNDALLHFFVEGTGLRFNGTILSDYRATRSTVDAALNGLDIQMPGCVKPDPTNPINCTTDSMRPNYFGEPLQEAVESGKVPMTTLDGMVERTLFAMISAGLLDRNATGTPSTNVTSPAHNALAREAAAEIATLIQNKHNLLPLDPTDFNPSEGGKKSLVVIGPAGHDLPVIGGGGSGAVTPAYISTVLQGIQDAVASSSTSPHTSATCSTETGIDYHQDAPPGHKNPSFPATTPGECCDGCSVRVDCHSFTWVNGVCWPKQNATGRVAKEGAVSGNVSSSSSSVSYYGGTDPSAAAAAAKDADVAVVVLSTKSSEGVDRESILLDNEDLANAAASVNPNTIVIAVTPGQFATANYSASTSAILVLWYPGQEEGNACADVLFGAHNPSGKLHLSLPIDANDTGILNPDQYPGINHIEHYSEKLEVGYRWYNAHSVAPAFPFGFGLSYSNWSVSNLEVHRLNTATFNVSVSLTNHGPFDGSNVVQLYLTYPSSAGEPPRQLKAFQKAFVRNEATTTLTLSLTPHSFSIYNPTTHTFELAHGTFQLHAGFSSALHDLPLQTNITIT